VNFQQLENAERWWQALSQTILQKIQHTQTHLSASEISETAAETLNSRVGTFMFSNGIRYQGTWDRGWMSGKGIWEYLGSVYEGEFTGDMRQGRGTMQYSNGQSYVGEWKNNLPNGKGQMTSDKGDFLCWRLERW